VLNPRFGNFGMKVVAACADQAKFQIAMACFMDASTFLASRVPALPIAMSAMTIVFPTADSVAASIAPSRPMTQLYPAPGHSELVSDADQLAATTANPFGTTYSWGKRFVNQFFSFGPYQPMEYRTMSAPRFLS
jgi:hypothetical protein